MPKPHDDLLSIITTIFTDFNGKKTIYQDIETSVFDPGLKNMYTINDSVKRKGYYIYEITEQEEYLRLNCMIHPEEYIPAPNPGLTS